MTMHTKAYRSTAVDDREKIISEFIPLIKHVAYKFVRGFDDEMLMEDLISAGARTKVKKMEAAIRKLERKLGRYPTEEEVSQEFHQCVMRVPVVA